MRNVVIATSYPLEMFILDASSDLALHAQVYAQLRAAILSGQLAPGTRLPSTRDLARDLGVARNTILTAFEHLGSEGYLEGHVGNGTYVSRQLPDELFRVDRERGPRRSRALARTSLSSRGRQVEHTLVSAANYEGKPRPFRTSVPALDAFPYALWSRLLQHRWRESARQLLTYGEPAGYRPLREAIARYVTTARGVRCQPENIVLTNGSLHAIELAARVLLDPGDAVWMEDPGFLGARAVFTSAGARLVPVPIDDEGMNVDAAIERDANARLAYVTPSHQYPLGPTLSLRRRLALLNWARRSGAWILEDDYDSEFRYNGRPLPSLQGMDAGERVIYAGTFSKMLFPSIRVGYIVAPAPLLQAFVAARSISGHATVSLDHAVLADFISGGSFARHLRRMRVLYAARQRALLSAARSELVGLLDVQPSDNGMHVIGWLRKGIDDASASEAAARHDVEVTPLSAYCIEPYRRGALRLGFSGYTPRQLWDAARRLARALSGTAAPTRRGSRTDAYSGSASRR